MKLALLYVLIMSLLGSKALAGDNDPVSACSNRGQITPESVTSFVKCTANSAVAMTAVLNLYKHGKNAVRLSEEYEDPGLSVKEQVVTRHSVIKTYQESVCLGDFADGMYGSLIDTKGVFGAIVRDQGPAAFLSSVWEVQKTRLAGKTWRGDFAPKMIGKGFDKAIKTAGGEDTALADLTSPVEVMAKHALLANTTPKEVDKDTADLLKKLRCGKIAGKVIDAAAQGKGSLLSKILDASGQVDSVKSKAEDYVLYLDMATLLAMNGGELGQQFINETLAPYAHTAKGWTLGQKAKAAQVGLKMKTLIDKLKKQSTNTSNAVVGRIEKGKELVAQTQSELDEKLAGANAEYADINNLINSIVKDGQSLASPPSVKNYTQHLRLFWAKARQDRDGQVSIMKERVRGLLCIAPDVALSKAQQEEKRRVCTEKEKNPKGTLRERATDKVKSLWSAFKNRG
jgi:hypothetical protein